MWSPRRHYISPIIFIYMCIYIKDIAVYALKVFLFFVDNFFLQEKLFVEDIEIKPKYFV